MNEELKWINLFERMRTISKCARIASWTLLSIGLAASLVANHARYKLECLEEADFAD